MKIDDYCREIEAYLCRKNDGHLIRIAGPSFDLVSGWAAAGVPVSIACQGIDRYFERYYRKGPRRRPVRIDFCEADVLDVFDEWRRALGLPAAPTEASGGAATLNTDEAATRERPGAGTSVPAHLERALLRLTNARASGALGDELDGVLDRLAAEVETARAAKGGVRGAARRALAERLAALDAELVTMAWQALRPDEQRRLEEEAAAEIAPFRSAMPQERYTHVLEIATKRRVRDRAGLPTLELA